MRRYWIELANGEGYFQSGALRKDVETYAAKHAAQLGTTVVNISVASGW